MTRSLGLITVGLGRKMSNVLLEIIIDYTVTLCLKMA